MRQLTLVRNGTKHNSLPIRTKGVGNDTIVLIGRYEIPLVDILLISMKALFNESDDSVEIQTLRKKFALLLNQLNEEEERVFKETTKN